MQDRLDQLRIELSWRVFTTPFPELHCEGATATVMDGASRDLRDTAISACWRAVVQDLVIPLTQELKEEVR